MFPQRKKVILIQKTLRSSKHVVNTDKINEIALSADDDKGEALKDGVNTLAIGHLRVVGKLGVLLPEGMGEFKEED